MLKAPAKIINVIAYFKCQQKAHETFNMEDAVHVTVLTVGDLVQYTVPSFPVFKATLREVKLQWEDKDKTIQVFDAFARDCDQLDHHLPAMAEVPFDYENAFIIEVRSDLLINYPRKGIKHNISC